MTKAVKSEKDAIRKYDQNVNPDEWFKQTSNADAAKDYEERLGKFLKVTLDPKYKTHFSNGITEEAKNRYAAGTKGAGKHWYKKMQDKMKK